MVVKFVLEGYHRNVSDTELLEDLRRVASDLNQISLPSRDYAARGGKYSPGTIHKRFGTWNNALVKAGLDVGSRKNISDEELYANLEAVWRHLGRQPRVAEIMRPLSYFSRTTYVNRFSSWRNALEAFIQYVSQAGEGELDSDKKIFRVETTQIRVAHASSRHINWRTRFLVMRRDDFKCRYCGRSPANNPGLELHVDHVHAWSKNGPSEMHNLCTACNVCNVGKSDLAATNL